MAGGFGGAAGGLAGMATRAAFFGACEAGFGTAAGFAIGAAEGAAFGITEGVTRTALMGGNATDIVMAGFQGGVMGIAIGGPLGAIFHDICFTAGTLVHSATGMRTIETLRVGQRTLTEGTKGSAGLTGNDPTQVAPETWRLVCLRTAKPAGSDNLVDVELLRPLAWIEQTRAVVGSQIHFNLPELGIDGPADVLAIEPCPEIEPGRGRVITGTFSTARCQVMRLGVSGEEKPLEPTPPHRFYSSDRGDYVPAERLAIGERLVTRAGEVATVQSIGMKPGLHRVYSLEVEGEHHYFVGESGVLVHNSYLEEAAWRQITPSEYEKLCFGGPGNKPSFDIWAQDSGFRGTPIISLRRPER